MPIRFYIMPAIASPNYDGQPVRHPAHLWLYRTREGVPMPLGTHDVWWALKDYGSIDRLIVAVDTDAATHDVIAAYADVLALPENLDAAPNTSTRNAIKTRLEGFNIPSGWVTTGMTYRTMLRTILGIFKFMQRFAERTGNLNPFSWGINLDTVFSSLSVARQDKIREIANSMGFNGDAIPAAWTLRQILKYAADELANEPVLFGRVTV